MRFHLILSLNLFAAIAAAQPASLPVVNAVENNYSFILPGLPNYGIAQGSIFAIFGSNLCPTYSGLQGLPLQATLDGVSVKIAVGGVTTQALLYYVSPYQIAGVLPSATPVGSGQITVIVNGQASAPAPITVVQSAFGIAVSNSYPANGAVFETQRGYWTALMASNAANPGETIEIYGTGGGPTTLNEAETQLPPQNLTNIPIEVDIGGIPSTVTFHGRSTWPGLDQIDVVIPPGVAGCNVSVAVVSSGLVSNVAFLPIAELGSRTCSDQFPGVVVPESITLSGSVVNDGQIAITRTVESPPAISAGLTTGAASSTDDFGSAVFYRNTATPGVGVGLGGGVQFPSLGNCEVQTSFTPGSSSPGPASLAQITRLARTTVSTAPTQTEINAGPNINFSDSTAQASINLTPSGFYTGGLTGAAPNSLFLPASGGTVSINNGNGGPDVGAFVFQMSVAAPLTWSNMLQLSSTINRSQGLTLTWTGGNPTGVAMITATSSANADNGMVSASVSCRAPISAGQFTIPASALLALPPGPGAKSGNGTFLPALQLSSRDQSVMFTAQGLDGAVVFIDVNNTLSISFQ